LLVIETRDAKPRCVREIEVWSRDRASVAVLEAAEGLPLTIDLTAGYVAPEAGADDGAAGEETVCASIPSTAVSETSVHVRHWLRLCVEPEDGNEQWNTLPVKIGLHGGALVAAPKGSLSSAPPRTRRADEQSGADEGVWRGVGWKKLVPMLLMLLGPKVASIWDTGPAQVPNLQHGGSGQRGSQYVSPADFGRLQAENDEDTPEIWVDGKGWVSV